MLVVYLAYVENNLGMLYFRINQCDEAHTHLDRARRVFQSLRDVGCVAQVDETRACVFLEQGRIAEAERVARLAVLNQEKSGRHGLLAWQSVSASRKIWRSTFGFSTGHRLMRTHWQYQSGSRSITCGIS